MTDDRKQEIIKALEDYNINMIDSIDKEEAEDFMSVLSKEENDYVYNLVCKNRQRRNREIEEERNVKRECAYYSRIHDQRRLVKYLSDHPDECEEAKLFTDRYLLEKKPVEINIKGFRTMYECPECTVSLTECQPFCVNCGLMIDWGDKTLSVIDEILRDKEKEYVNKK